MDPHTIHSLQNERYLGALLRGSFIHQDFSISGSGPMIEIFSDRIEITNPGEPLIAADRLLDLPPKSRNEDLAAFMSRINICEECGSGIDKVINAAEKYQLPPPDFRTPGGCTRVILYGLREHSEMTPDERVRACYQHACLLIENGGQKMSNATLRARLGIEDQNYTMATRVISMAKELGLIKPADPTSPKPTHYLPFLRMIRG
jgi:predicted HTH transcriptional regulator